MKSVITFGLVSYMFRRRKRDEGAAAEAPKNRKTPEDPATSEDSTTEPPTTKLPSRDETADTVKVFSRLF